MHNPVELPAASAPCVNGFSNNTPLPTGQTVPEISPSYPIGALSPSTSTLWKLWNISQLNLSTEPIPYLDGRTESPNPAAATMQPDCQAVVAVPDLTDQQLYKATGDSKWLTHAEPTGAFICEGTTVYGCFVNNTVYCATSICWNSDYEMENGILCRLNECSGR
jgi:hypothetical protein